ncbi:2-keto-4-pentenoate hydratase [Nocardioides psychrotolerans]|uniref:2-keto-4-pentenoate hydratase n=1 Tax=Nocardioides psychrotolerans TaxID=1005945 RepID=A0A1I3NKR4_9ACTN|nr:2-keto-4-pentenoate hydratase [Nocardioides psychrotolerans]GEP39433.1 2-keto-4-pentenoate hydratase [Nocardioides psychrotolerans]SFJ09346.1 2-keto-4-pentenoate hydratase [Nocardioides psychrotolerans]
MDDKTRADAAQLLFEAYSNGKPVSPLTSTYDDLTLEDAYAIQLLQIDWFLEQGRSVKGHKVGLTSVAMQRLLGVDQPDYGHLLDDFFHLEHEPIAMGRFLQPRIEPEVAFVLKRRLRGPGVTAHEAIAAVDFVLPALEIVDSRIEDWKIGLFDTIADNASSGAVVLGSTPTAISDVDLRLAGTVMTQNGTVVGTGAGGAVLGSPLRSLVWLANTVGARGVTLEEGQVVLPGSVCAMVPVSAGDSVTATFAGLGSVTALFAPDEEDSA